MLSINSLLSPACVLIHPDAKDKASLIKMMIESLKAAGKTNNTELLLKDVMTREELSPHNAVFDVPNADLDKVFDWIDEDDR